MIPKWGKQPVIITDASQHSMKNYEISLDALADEKMLFERRCLQLFICPPWGIYKLLSDIGKRGSMWSRIFLFVWVLSQWLVLIHAGSNIIINTLTANLAVTMFFLMNLYFGLDAANCSEEELDRVRNILVIIVITTAIFVLMYKIPIAFGWAANKIIGTGAVQYSKIDRLLMKILVSSWFIFAIATRYKLFDMFPKTQMLETGDLRALTDERICAIIFTYVMMIAMSLRYDFM